MELVLDHVVIAVAELAPSRDDYQRLLGRRTSWHGSHPTFGTRNTLFRLDNTYLELLAPGADGGPLADVVTAALRDRAERAFALALGVRDLDAAIAELRARGIDVGDPADGSGTDDASGRQRSWRSAFVDPASVRGLRLLVIEHRSPPDALPPAPFASAPQVAVSAVDHVVLFSDDLDASVALWSERLGLPVRSRHDFPERGTRNVLLDLHGIVLELITRTDRAPSGRDDVFWGVAYRIADCASTIERLRAAGLDARDMRDGLAPGTTVASLRWPRTPTLLIQP